MSEIVQTPTAPASESVLTAPDPNSAVTCCRQAYRQTFKTVMAQGRSEPYAASNAREAYIDAMPPLSGADNIRDYIACVARAMLTGIIKSADGARLLYAAQIASTMLEKPAPGKPGRPAPPPLPNN